MGISGCTALVLPGMSEKQLRRHLVNYDEYMARLGEIMSRGLGLIAITGHLGNWESLAGIGSRRFPANVVANRLNSPGFNDLLQKLRRASGLRVIFLSESPREIVRALKRREIVGLLPDQDIRYLPGVWVDFFGAPAYTPVGPVLAARLSGAPVYPFFLLRDGARFRFAWGDEIPMVFTGDRKVDLLKNTTAWMRVMENLVRRYPDQWSWNHRRWKTQPGDPRAGIR